MLNIDRKLCYDLDALGFTRVVEHGWKKYKLPEATFARQCELWIQRQLELARIKARYDHEEETNVDYYLDQLAQCRSTFNKQATARLMTEALDPLPVPPAPKAGQAQGPDVNFGKDMTCWAENVKGKIEYVYYCHAALGIFLTVTTDRNIKITEREIIGTFKEAVDLDALDAALPRGKKLTRQLFDSALKICRAKSATARVADEPDNLLPNSQFKAAGLTWNVMESDGTNWYDAEVRSNVFVSVLVSNNEISDAFVSINGTLRNESDSTKAAIRDILGSEPTIKNLEKITRALFPRKTATARVASEHDQSLSFSSLPSEFSIDHTLFKLFSSSSLLLTYKSTDGRHQIDMLRTGRVTISGDHSRVTRSLLMDFNVTETKFKRCMASLAPYFRERVTARVAEERSDLVPQRDFELDGSFWSVENGAKSDLYKCKAGPNNWLLIEVGDDCNIKAAWLEDAMMHQKRVKALNKIAEFIDERRRATMDNFERLLKIARSAPATLSMIGAGLTPALEVVQARFAGELADVTFKTLPSTLKLGRYNLKLTKRTPYDVNYSSDNGRIALSIDSDGSIIADYHGRFIPRDYTCDKLGEFSHEPPFKFPMSGVEFKSQLDKLGRRVDKYVRAVQANARANTVRLDALKRARQNHHGLTARVASEHEKFNSVVDLPDRIEVDGEVYNDTGAFKSQVTGTFRTYRGTKKIGGKSVTLNIYDNGEITAHLLVATIAVSEDAVKFPSYSIEFQRGLDEFGQKLKQRLAHEGWD